MRRKFSRERRQHPRIKRSLPIRLVANGYDFSTTTQDLSCVGAYCHITKYIPPFTKIAIKLSLPIRTKCGGRKYDVKCKGVLVRTEDEEKGGFNIAIFFNEIKEYQKKIISQYVNQFLPKAPSVLEPSKPRWAK